MLIADGIEKRYRSGARELTVLQRVDLRIRSGELVAVLGPSGSGKSTLLGILAGLDTPSAGRVMIEGTDIVALDEDARARFRRDNVGFVFQSFQLIPSLTALENVQVPLELRGERAVRNRAMALLERVGLGDRTTHYPAQLSGGEQQRVAVARAFVHSPRVLFADEPTGNLDAGTGSAIIELIEELNAEHATTVVMVTHDLELAARAKRTIRLADGRIVSDTQNAA